MATMKLSYCPSTLQAADNETPVPTIINLMFSLHYLNILPPDSPLRFYAFFSKEICPDEHLVQNITLEPLKISPNESIKHVSKCQNFKAV